MNYNNVLIRHFGLCKHLGNILTKDIVVTFIFRVGSEKAQVNSKPIKFCLRTERDVVIRTQAKLGVYELQNNNR